MRNGWAAVGEGTRVENLQGPRGGGDKVPTQNCCQVTGKPEVIVSSVAVPRNAPAVTDYRWREADFAGLIPLGKPDKPCPCLHSLPRSGAQVPPMQMILSFRPFALMCAAPAECSFWTEQSII